MAVATDRNDYPRDGECSRCGGVLGHQPIVHDVGATRVHLCIDCCCELAADLARDVADLVRIEERKERTRAERAALLGAYEALGLSGAVA